MKKFFVSAFLATFVLCECFAWGQKGHDTVCAIAQNHLSDNARAFAADLLDGRSLVYWANWLDNASNTPEYAYSKTWHYKNVDADQQYEDVEVFEKGDIVSALTIQTSILENYLSSQRIGAPCNVTREEASLALKMIIHLVGDIHQPLHVGHKSDLGGNRWQVQFFNNGTNLHSAWDSQILESGHKWSHTEWAEELDRGLVDETRITCGSYDDWCRETWRICCDVYDLTPSGTKISYDYVAEWTPVIELQLLKGGLRLARVLNKLAE